VLKCIDLLNKNKKIRIEKNHLGYIPEIDYQDCKTVELIEKVDYSIQIGIYYFIINERYVNILIQEFMYYFT